MSNSKVDVIGTYISQLLIPRLNAANELYQKQDFIGAIGQQQGVIRTLQRISEDDLEELKGWEQEIYDIFEEAKKIEGITADETQADRENFLANKFSRKYKDLDWKIWDKLHDLGYFSRYKQHGPDDNDIDMSGAEKI